MKNSPKKSQMTGDLFKYALIAVVSVVILAMGYQMVRVIKDRACSTDIAKFEIDLKNIDKSLRFGVRELQTYNSPCNVKRIYFFDLSKSIDAEKFSGFPIIKDTLKNEGSSNIFLVEDSKVKRSFFAGNLQIEEPFYLCFAPSNGRISFYAEGAGRYVKITAPDNQPLCS